MAAPTAILFLAWYFPPIGGAGVQRSLKFVRLLPAHGFRPLVLAGPVAAGSRWTPSDASLQAELPPDLVLHRPEPPRPPSRWQQLQTRLWSEDVATANYWRRFVADAGTSAARTHGAAAIFVTLGPFECLQGALDLGARLRLPVVADLRDPWAFDEMRTHGHRLGHWFDERRMLRRLARCAAVIMNTPVAADLLRRRLPALAARVHCITNGFDQGDFVAPPPPPDADRFRLVHTGYLHCDGALQQDRTTWLRRLRGGGRPDVDLWGRTHRYLLLAMERLAATEPALAARLELHLYGLLSDADHAVTARSPVRDRVFAHGYQSHAEAIAAMRAADALFLPMQGLAGGKRATIVPGKTYEYLASLRPILAAVPPGDARDFVAAAQGDVVDPDDVDGLTVALRRLVAAGRRPDRAPGPEVARFERRALTAQLAAVLRGALSG